MLFSTHDPNLISVFIHIVQSTTLVGTAVLHIAEAGYIDLTGAVGASGSRLRFGGGDCGRLLIGGRLLILGFAFLLRYIFCIVILRQSRGSGGGFRLFRLLRFDRVGLDRLLQAAGVSTLGGICFGFA